MRKNTGQPHQDFWNRTWMLKAEKEKIKQRLETATSIPRTRLNHQQALPPSFPDDLTAKLPMQLAPTNAFERKKTHEVFRGNLVDVKDGSCLFCSLRAIKNSLSLNLAAVPIPAIPITNTLPLGDVSNFIDSSKLHGFDSMLIYAVERKPYNEVAYNRAYAMLASTSRSATLDLDQFGIFNAHMIPVPKESEGYELVAGEDGPGLKPSEKQQDMLIVVLVIRRPQNFNQLVNFINNCPDLQTLVICVNWYIPKFPLTGNQEETVRQCCRIKMESLATTAGN